MHFLAREQALITLFSHSVWCAFFMLGAPVRGWGDEIHCLVHIEHFSSFRGWRGVITIFVRGRYFLRWPIAAIPYIILADASILRNQVIPAQYLRYSINSASLPGMKVWSSCVASCTFISEQILQKRRMSRHAFGLGVFSTVSPWASGGSFTNISWALWQWCPCI